MIFEADGFDEVGVVLLPILEVLSDDFLEAVDVELLLEGGVEEGSGGELFVSPFFVAQMLELEEGEADPELGALWEFLDAGAEWRNAGCSMCLGMNPDQLAVGERSASTSNRNFEGRQGKGGRTHLVSPLVAAATALRGTLSSPSDL